MQDKRGKTGTAKGRIAGNSEKLYDPGRIPVPGFYFVQPVVTPLVEMPPVLCYGSRYLTSNLIFWILKMTEFVRVAVKIRADKNFTYSVPEKFRKDVEKGKRVLVPLGRRKVIGCILETLACSDVDSPRDIVDVLDSEPLFGERDLEFYRWTSEYYFYSLGRLITEMIPGGAGVKSEKVVKLSAPMPDLPNLCAEQLNILKQLSGRAAGITEESLREASGNLKNFAKLINDLEKVGVVTFSENVRISAVRPRTGKFVRLADANYKGQEGIEREIVSFLGTGPSELSTLKKNFGPVASTLKKLKIKGIISISDGEIDRLQRVEGMPDKNVVRELSEEQKSALLQIESAILKSAFSPFLLHGVTGSGKTEIYLNVIRTVLDRGGNALYLVPEIALTPQLIGRIESRFGNTRIAVLHSQIPEQVRYDQWRAIHRGEVRIVLGARSAVFAPITRLGVIIVDEEHDSSYKQEERIRYNARDLAIVKAKQNSAVIVLGSATPGIQAFQSALQGHLNLLSLRHRVESRCLPPVRVVDMRAQRGSDSRIPVVSSILHEALEKNLVSGGQALLLLNRRGFNTFVHCRDCGYVFKCTNCSVSLVLHAAECVMKCHYCDYNIKAPPLCPACRGWDVGSYGFGTQRLQKELVGLFPSARIGRMDRDTTSRWGAHRRILSEFGRGDLDILIGTQMISKGHDYPNVRLVGIISADSSLNMPDFRAAEKTFQLLTQMSGRSGRGDYPGEVIIQTFNPDHYAISRAKEHDFQGFFQDEIKIRRELEYPPFSRIIKLEISSLKASNAEEGAAVLGGIVREISRRERSKFNVEILGPAEAPVARIKNRYRRHILLKSKSVRSLHALLREALGVVQVKGCEVKIDVDPVNFV